MDVLGGHVLPPAYSPREEAFKPICSLAFRIFSRHWACSCLNMQSECMAAACREREGQWEGQQGSLEALSLSPGARGEGQKQDEDSDRETSGPAGTLTSTLSPTP